MKLPCLRSSRRSGFTLVELLVVIAIIAILASVITVSAGLAINAAKRAKANATASQIQTAVLNYYTEYSVYPLPANTATDYAIYDNDQADWGDLIVALSGNVNPQTGQAQTPTIFTNARGIAYLTLKSTDVAKTGAPAPLNPLPTSTTVNLYFNIGIDGNYDGVIGADGVVKLPNFATATSTTTFPTSGATGGTSTAGVAVWANCNGSTTSTHANFWVHTY